MFGLAIIVEIVNEKANNTAIYTGLILFTLL